MAMEMLNGLPDRFDSLISALDAADTNDAPLNLEFVQSRCLQEEQRHTTRDKEGLKSAETGAPMATKRPNSGKHSSEDTCMHCGKQRDCSRCYTTWCSHPSCHSVFHSALSAQIWL